MIKNVEETRNTKSSGFDKFTTGLAILVMIWFVYFLITDVLPEKRAENELYSVIYSKAVEEVRSHWAGEGLYVEKYENDKVVYHTTDYDDWGQHFEENHIITVYYCKGRRGEENGVEYSVEAHFFVADMFTGILEE